MEHVWIVGLLGYTFLFCERKNILFQSWYVLFEEEGLFPFWSPHRRPKALCSGLTVEMSLQEHGLCCLSDGRGWGCMCCSSVDLWQVLQVQRQPCISVMQQLRAHRADADPREVKPLPYLICFFCPCVRHTGIEAFKVQPIEVLDVAQEPQTPLVTQWLTWVMRLFEHLYSQNIEVCQPHVTMSLYMPKAYEMWHLVYEESAKELLFMLFYKNEDKSLRWSNIVGYH